MIEVWLIFLGLLSIHALAADVCAGNEVLGPYGAQLSGVTRIAGTPKPAVSLARLVFNADKTVSGYSSAARLIVQ